MPRRLPLALALAALALALLPPQAAAEFGPESEDGWPINVEGDVLRPPVPPLAVAPRDDDGEPLNKAGPFTAYPYYPILTAEVQRLAQDHPDLVRLTSAGKSTAQLDQWLLEIADFARIESGEGIPLEDREVVYLDGGTHSNEYSGVYFVTEVAQFLLDEYETNETAKWIVENRHVWILPMINPDGSNAFGRINAKGININRNFPGTWGTVDEDPILNNPGPEPASETETRNVIALLETIRPDYVNSIHCCGNLWLHPWGAESLDTPPDATMFTRICDEVFADVRDRCGEIWSTIYPASGTTADEGYSRVGASSWTYEMSGRGAIAAWGQPAIMDDVRAQEVESWRGVMHALTNVEKYGARPEIIALEGHASELVATIENVGWGNHATGNLTIAGASVPIPPLAPGERAEVRVSGAFAAGDLAVAIDWQKRAWKSPVDARVAPLALEERGGRLVAAGLAAASARDEDGGFAIPFPAPALAGVAVAVALALRRRFA